MRRSAIILLALGALIAPATAGAQTGGSPFAPSPSAPAQPAPSPPVQQAPQPIVDDTSSDDGLSKGQEILIFAVGLALLGGIAWFIVRDAHAAAPVADIEQEHEQEHERTKVTTQHRAASRKRAKAARRQRKRNRVR